MENNQNKFYNKKIINSLDLDKRISLKNKKSKY